jgi:hypothetical protein
MILIEYKIEDRVGWFTTFLFEKTLIEEKVKKTILEKPNFKPIPKYTRLVKKWIFSHLEKQIEISAFHVILLKKYYQVKATCGDKCISFLMESREMVNIRRLIAGRVCREIKLTKGIINVQYTCNSYLETGDGKFKDENCPICLDDYTDPFTLVCHHVFCWQCITQWLKNKNNCPKCKRNVMPLYKHAVTPLRKFTIEKIPCKNCKIIECTRIGYLHGDYEIVNV